jgi:hypothetical protein
MLFGGCSEALEPVAGRRTRLDIRRRVTARRVLVTGFGARAGLRDGTAPVNREPSQGARAPQVGMPRLNESREPIPKAPKSQASALARKMRPRGNGALQCGIGLAPIRRDMETR